MSYGTYTTLDTLAAQFANTASVLQVGEDRIYEEVEKIFAIQNDLLRQQLEVFGEYDSERIATMAGGIDAMVMEEVDQFGTPDAQKIAVPSGNMGFPLRKYAGSLQWTRAYLQVATVAQLSKDLFALQNADTLLIQRLLQRAFYNPTNYVFKDRLIDHYDLNVKALANADSMYIPANPLTGAAFDASTHTHYKGYASGAFAAADLTALIQNVREHFGGTIDIKVFIPQGLENTVRGFTGFMPYPDQRIIPADNTVRLNPALGSLDIYNLNNRAIGIFDVAEVWVKPWCLANYVIAINLAGLKPLRIRTRIGGSGDLVLGFEDENHPLRAKTYEREIGIAVRNRYSAAVLYTGGSSYVAPTIN